MVARVGHILAPIPLIVYMANIFVKVERVKQKLILKHIFVAYEVLGILYNEAASCLHIGALYKFLTGTLRD